LYTLFLNKTQRMRRGRQVEDEEKELVTNFVNTEQATYSV
jgi:hypothetical protein